MDGWMDGGMETGREGLALSSFAHIYLQTSGHCHDHLLRHVPFLYFLLSSLKFDYNVPKLAEQYATLLARSAHPEHSRARLPSARSVPRDPACWQHSITAGLNSTSTLRGGHGSALWSSLHVSAFSCRSHVTLLSPLGLF